MLMRYVYLRTCPDVFWKLTGLSLSDFRTLIAELLPCYVAMEHQRRNREDRKRAIGVSQPTVWRYIEKVTPLLEAALLDRITMQDPGRKQRLRMGELFEEIPELLKCIPPSDTASDWLP